ncbi:MAG: Gfo/Idh/MocA family oxidoreductase [Pseudomonadota bacterium]
MTLHYGLIGCGMMGHEHIANIRLLEDTQVSVIYEPNASMAASAAKNAPDAVMASSLEALLAHKPLDALVITSPNYLHVEQLEAITQRVDLPILCEKPLYTDQNDSHRIAQIKNTYKAPIWVAMEYRYMPPIARFIEQVSESTGGVKLLSIVEHRFPFLPKINNWNRFNAQTGGTFVEKCCHFFDLMRHILNSDPVRVMASAGQEVNHLTERYDGRSADIWDCGYVICDFANGARAMLELSMFAEGEPYQEKVHAVGHKGKLEALVPGPARFWPDKLGPAPTPKLITSPRHPKGPIVIEVPVDHAILGAGDHNGATYYQHQKFRDVVAGLGPVEVSLDDGAWAVRMGLAAQKSATTGQSVALTLF